MLVETVHEGIRYTLCNDNLKVNDEVFPIASGRCLDDGGWVLHKIEFESKNFECFYPSGFPNEPHIILDLNYDNGKQGKPYQVRTNCGFSPIECYYKIIKKEQQIKVSDSIFGGSYEWVKL